MKNPLFYAKILLFGEYGIIENANGLTLPYNLYKGMLLEKAVSHEHKESNKVLREYVIYLETHLPDIIDIKLLKKSIEKGLSFDSDIPQGYGVGSSGALVAAIYSKYGKNPMDLGKSFDKDKLPLLKSIFSKMEAYFHGKSSGIDPLICYLNIPLLIKPGANITHIGIPQSNTGNGAIFLLNSGSPGKTEPMVEIFFEKLKNQGFRKTLKNEFIKYNNACIESFLKGDFHTLIQETKQLSGWVLEHFKPMIPQRVLKIWQEGIDTNLYYLKLCGSGGGGYLLGFTADYSKTKTYLQEYETEVILRF